MTPTPAPKRRRALRYRLGALALSALASGSLLAAALDATPNPDGIDSIEPLFSAESLTPPPAPFEPLNASFESFDVVIDHGRWKEVTLSDWTAIDTNGIDRGQRAGSIDAGSFAPILSEIWTASIGRGAPDGSHKIELDANRNRVDAIYQDVLSEAGVDYSLSFSAYARHKTSSDIEVWIDGSWVKTIRPAHNGWRRYNIAFEGTGDATTLMLREVPSQDNGVGAIIDAVQVLDPAADSLSIASGRVDVGDGGLFVPFDSAIDYPVIVPGVPSDHDQAPGVVEISEVGSDGFTIAFREWSYLDGAHALEDIDWFALPQGRYRLADGTQVEAGTVTLEGSKSWSSVDFNERFDGTPYLFLSVMHNAGAPVTPRARKIDRDGFDAALFAEDTAAEHEPVVIGYVAIRLGAEVESLGGLDIDLTRRKFDHRAKGAFEQTIWMQEEQSLDSEVGHTWEKLDLMLLDGGIFAQDGTTRGPDTAAPRRWSDDDVVVIDGFQITAKSWDSVDLDWNPAYGTGQSLVHGYRVLANGTAVAEVPVGTSEASIDGLRSHTWYRFLVQALGANGEVLSESKTLKTRTLRAPKPPANPSRLRATDVTHASLTLTWRRAARAATYRVHRDGELIATTEATRFSDEALTPQTSYNYFVTAVNAHGFESRGGASRTVTTLEAPDVEPPAAPTYLRADAVAPTSVSLSWTAAVDDRGIDHYLIKRDGELIGQSNTTSFSDGNLDEVTTYSYQVLAVDAAGNSSEPSGDLTITTPDGSAPSEPGELDAVVIGETIHLTWAASSDNVGVHGYHLFRDHSLIATTAETGFVDTAPVIGTEHRYQVSAFDAAGNESSLSAAADARVEPLAITGETLAETCMGCHNADGQSAGEAMPILAGIDKGYFEDAMDDFASGDRHSTMMGRIAGSYSEGEIALMGEYFAAQPYSPAAQAYNLELAAEGERLHQSYCQGCHGTAGADLDNGTLAGNWKTYIKATLDDFAEGRSTSAPGAMINALSAMPALGREALAHYYASYGGLAGAPPAPVELEVADRTEYSMTLTWVQPSSEWQISHYVVLRNGIEVGESEFTAFTDSGLEPGEIYGFSVVAVDLEGNRSVASETVVERTEGEPLIDTPDLSRGQDLWNANGCANCHGSPETFIEGNSAENIANAIANPNGSMKTFSNLSGQDMADIAAYLYDTQTGGGGAPGGGSDTIEGLSLLDNQATLRKAAILLAARLPSDEEKTLAETDAGLRTALRDLMDGERFTEFVEHTASLAFLPAGALLDTNPLREDWPLLEEVRENSGGEFNRTVADMRLEPVALTRYIVENDRPYTEMLTADYTMVTPRSAHVYGATPLQPFSGEDDGEFRPARLPSVSQRDSTLAGKAYPHAGVLTTQAWLSRFPTTDSNRNRHRAKMLYLQFYGFNLEALGQRPLDDSANGDYLVPTMENPACTLCHIPMDPVAGGFQNWGDDYQYLQKGSDSLADDYKSASYQTDHFGAPWYALGDRWYRDLFLPGFNGINMPGAQHGFDRGPANGILPPASPNHVVERGVWNGISGTALSRLESDSRYPGNPDLVSYLDHLESPRNVANNYGQRLRALIVPQTSGSYTFWISGDDNASLRLSPSTDEAAAAEIASVPGWSDYREWDKYPDQQSVPVELTAGTAYYVEVLNKEGGGGDHVSVAWTGPGIDEISIIGPDVLRSAPGSVDREPGEVPYADNHNGGSDALQWLAREVVDDPRFAKGAALFWYRGLFGRPPLSAPMDPAAPGYDEALTAYQTQDGVIQGIADRFADSGMRVKDLLVELIMSDLFRARETSEPITDEQRIALADIGMSRLLTPGEIDAKGQATVGWTFFDNHTSREGLLFGGFDGGRDALNPNVDLTPTMVSTFDGRMLRRLCDYRMVSADLSLTPEERVLLPFVDDNLAPYPLDISTAPSAEHVVEYSLWLDIGGSNSLDALTNLASYPSAPSRVDWLDTMDSPYNVDDKFGHRLRALLVPPVDGTYVFWVSGDDQASLKLSDSADPDGLVEIAQVPGYSNRYQWTKYPEQQSMAIQLTAGQAYLIEAIGKEGYGGDHLSVAWSGPGFERQLITAEYLQPAESLVNANAMIDRIKQNIAYLHERLLGEALPLDHAEIERTFALFKEVYENEAPEPSDLQVYCEVRNGSQAARRGWMAVLAYLMSDFRYLHE